jgi:hypothetical protein
MKCPKCGTNNPNFFRKCVDCGTKLPKIDPLAKKKQLMLIYGVIGLCVVALLTVAVINFPAIEGWALSLPAFFHAAPVSTAPHITQFSTGQPARYGDIQITVGDSRSGGITFNNQIFYTVVITLKNFQTKDSAHFTTSDFVLVDSSGTQFLPAGIGDGITYDLGPGATGSIEVRYIIPKDAGGLKLRVDTGKTTGSVSGSYYDFVL